MKKILFLYCGGTIGQVPRMVKTGGTEMEVYFPPQSDTEFKEACAPILEQVAREFDLDITFELITTKDSSNMTPDDWQAMARRVAAAQDDDGFHGIGIAHGTDTLAYTATALALSLHGTDATKSGLSIPVVLTGAQNSIYVSNGDGRFNLHNLFAVLAAAIDEDLADVLVSFWNRVLLGSRANKMSEREFDAFQSPMYPDVGTINALGVKLYSQYVRKRSDASFQMTLADRFDTNIVTLDLFPGFRPDILDKLTASVPVKAIILRTFGAGHIPIDGEYSLEASVTHLTQDMDIPVILATKFAGGSVSVINYEPGMRAVECGAIQSLDHTGVAVEVKTQWLIGNNMFHSVDGFKKAFHTSYTGEVTV